MVPQPADGELTWELLWIWWRRWSSWRENGLGQDRGVGRSSGRLGAIPGAGGDPTGEALVEGRRAGWQDWQNLEMETCLQADEAPRLGNGGSGESSSH